jgi:hypothetical protein
MNDEYGIRSSFSVINARIHRLAAETQAETAAETAAETPAETRAETAGHP